MRWIRKFFTEDNEPELGDERVHSGFLWLPKAVRDETRWLVHATWRERYVWTHLGRGREVQAWRAVEWIDEEGGREALGELSINPYSARPPMAEGAVEAVLRGGPYGGTYRKIRPDATIMELHSTDESGHVRMEVYEVTGWEGGCLVLEHVQTRIVGPADSRKE